MTMNGYSNSQVILGIKLRSDGFVDKSNCYDDGVIVGSIICGDPSLKCSDFRKLLNAATLCLPEKFQFLSNYGWPIDQSDEHKIEISQLSLSNIVTIQRYFEIPRLGVKWHNGEFIGFIFISFNSSLIAARQTINDELNHKFLDPEAKFEFIDTHGWPVSASQENDLYVWDISKGNICLINRLSAKRKASPQDLKIKKKNLRLSDKKGFQVPQKSKSSTSILISYVHAEAMSHAKDLKNELIIMGIDSVFLDIDDIYAGQDWQDVVNTALNNCTAFVALVTNRYGETKWTNREAKLADDKDKLIIPISFLDKWPPDQLAIQFLSLQYIPWISKDDFISEEEYFAENDISQWNPRSVHRVAKKIKQLCSESDVSTPDSSSLFDSQSSRHQINEPCLPYAAPQSSAFSKSNLKKPLIVISAHPHQKTFVDKLIQHLDTEYEVWSSITVNAENGIVCNVFDDSQSFESSPCMESNSQIKTSQSYSASSEVDGASKGLSCGWVDCSDIEYYQCEKSEFKKMVKNASLVILLNSEDYNKTRVCRQQAFYCEQRIEVIVIKYGSFQTDTLLLNLYPEQDMIEISSEQITKFNEGFLCNNFIKKLKEEIIKSLETSKHRNSYKDQIQNQVAILKTEIKTETVYVIGGTNCVSKLAEAFCINLGSELAKLKKLTLVTEGFFGAGEIVGKNFCEEKEILAKGKPKYICYHVLPHRDPNITKRARQREDGRFEKIPYGRTLFYGDSIAERDDIVSSTFKTCILIEGGERSASLAEKFLWNDCAVIPIIFNNRAISSKICLSASIKKPPLGVSKQDWCKLEKFSSVEDLAKTVKKIISDLFKARFKSLE